MLQEKVFTFFRLWYAHSRDRLKFSIRKSRVCFRLEQDNFISLYRHGTRTMCYGSAQSRFTAKQNIVSVLLGTLYNVLRNRIESTPPRKKHAWIWTVSNTLPMPHLILHFYFVCCPNPYIGNRPQIKKTRASFFWLEFMICE